MKLIKRGLRPETTNQHKDIADEIRQSNRESFAILAQITVLGLWMVVNYFSYL